jgi:serine/threonine protein kinase/Tol biopolymer transport system component/DNA-binding winged helix-turn-helix (wHTH) protein
MRFGDFELDVRAGELRKHGIRIRLQDQSFQILLMLLDRPGEVLLREEIRLKLWPNNTIVEFDHSINAAVKRLRNALGEAAEVPVYIETLARRGYRFIGTVETLPAASSPGAPTILDLASDEVPRLDPNDLSGVTVSHFRILQKLGSGGMGVVYRAEDLKLGREVALKFLPLPAEEASPQMHTRFQREARAASALNHPNICTVYEVEEWLGQAVIVMELLEGQPLNERIAGRPMPIHEVVETGIQIAGALDAAHRKGIIHRDIKPANIFLTRQGPAKVLDFGLAKFEPGLVAGEGTATQVTQPGTAMGTLHYMAPEQLLGNEADERSDLFSLGLVLYEMATGLRAFGGEVSAAVQDAILNRCPTPAVRLNPEVPAGLEDILSKLLEKDRLFRCQSAAEVVADLKRLRRELELEKSGPAVTRPRPRSLHSRLGVTAALALVLASGAIFWRLGRAPSMSELKMRQVTFNSNESPVEAAQISPDGKYLIFRDAKGLHLMAMATRETRTIPLPEEFRGADIGDSMWFPDGTHLLIGAILAGQQRPSIWALSALGGPVTKLRDDALPGYISPSGSSVPFTANLGRVNYREIWKMDSNGANAKKLLQAEDDNTGFEWPGWTPKDRRLTYIKYHETAKQFEVRIESSDLKGGLPATLYSETAYSFEGRRLQSYILLPDGRMIVSLNESGAGRGSISTLGQRGNLWITRAGDPTATTSTLKRLTDWQYCLLSYFSVTADGKRLAFIRDEGWGSVYVAGFGTDRTTTAPRQMTTNFGHNHPEAWTPDSKAVLISSDRDGHLGIYRQLAGTDAAEPIATGSDNAWAPFISPDGSWILYMVYPETAGSGPTRVMRVPLAGGPPQEVLTSAGVVDAPRCARSPASLCAIAERTQDARQIVFMAFDPLKGRGRELTRFAIDPNDPDFIWNLSPDGSRIALLKMLERPPTVNTLSEGPIHILPLDGGARLDLNVKGWKAFGQYADWSADGKGLFVSSPTEAGDALLYVDMEGNARKVWEHGPMKRATRGVPSPDGRYLALLGRNSTMNVWLIEGF